MASVASASSGSPKLKHHDETGGERGKSDMIDALAITRAACGEGSDSLLVASWMSRPE